MSLIVLEHWSCHSQQGHNQRYEGRRVRHTLLHAAFSTQSVPEGVCPGTPMSSSGTLLTRTVHHSRVTRVFERVRYPARYPSVRPITTVPGTLETSLRDTRDDVFSGPSLLNLGHRSKCRTVSPWSSVDTRTTYRWISRWGSLPNLKFVCDKFGGMCYRVDVVVEVP